MKKLFIFSSLIFIISNSLFAKTPIHECDNLAAHPDDPFKVTEGIEWDYMNAEEAVAECSKALNNYPDEGRFKYQLARALNKTGNYEKSFIYAQEASENNYPMAFYLLGLMYYYGDLEFDYDKAIIYFKKSLVIKSINLNIKYYVASSYYLKGDYSKSIDLFLDLEQEKDFEWRFSVLLELGSSHYYLLDNSYIDDGIALNEYNKAIKYFKRIIEEDLFEQATELELSKFYHRLAFSLDEIGDIDAAVKYYQKNVDSFENNNDLKKDEKITELYSNSAYNLSQIFFYKEEYYETIKILEKLIKLNPNYNDAYTDLAWMYSEGKGVNQNSNKALEILLSGTEIDKSGLINNNLGLMYESGQGVEQDYEKAKEFYLKSTKQNNTITGYLNLGYLYQEGLGVDVNIQQAKKIYLEGIELYQNRFKNPNYIFSSADEPSFLQISNFLEYLETQENNAAYNYKKTDFNPELQVCEKIINMVQSGFNQQSSFDKCFNLANQGDVDAQYYIGLFYLDGYVVSKNFSQAAKWFKKSLLQDDVYAKYEYSNLLLNGHIKDEEIDLVNLLNEIIYDEDKTNRIKALYNLGIAYKYGIYVKKDLDKALKIFKNINKFIDYNQVIRESAIDRANEIKSIKAGFAVEDPLLNLFPIKFEGKSLWEDSNDGTNWNNVIFQSIKEIGPDRFEIKGHYVTDYNNDEIVYVNLIGKINSKLKSIEIWENNPISSDLDFDPEDDWVTEGSYVGFYNDNFTEINAFWIPEKTGPRGTLNLKHEKILRGKDKIVDLKSQLNFGKYYAIVIGNNNYENMEDLDTARIDATTVASVLENKYGFEILKVLTDATEKQIISNLYSINKLLSPYDNLLIYYAGHGYMDEETERGYWLPIDANTIESEDTSSWISVDDISNILTKLSAKHILVVADSCYSGSLVLRSPSSTSDISYKHYKQLLEKKARKALTSGALQPVADGGGQGHSVFANAFLKILSDNDKVIDTNSIFNQVNKIVSNSPFTDQTPLYNVVPRTGDEGGDFIFVPQN